MPRSRVIRHSLRAVAVVLLLGALAVVSVYWLGAAGRASAEETVAAWLRAAQRGDVPRMLELTHETRRDEIAEHNILIRRLVHDTRPINPDEAGAATFTFELLPQRTRYPDERTASVIVELVRHGESVVREYQVVLDQGRWYVASWRNLSTVE